MENKKEQIRKALQGFTYPTHYLIVTSDNFWAAVSTDPAESAEDIMDELEHVTPDVDNDSTIYVYPMPNNKPVDFLSKNF